MAGDVDSVADVASDGDVSTLDAPVEVDQLVITSIVLKVGGHTITARPGDHVQVQVGDLVEVIGINVECASASPIGGVLAMEGYVRKPHEGLGGDGFDYGDGRFGAPATKDPIAAGSLVHPGLEGGWKAEAGWDRFSIAMVRYDGDLVEVEDRLHLILQVGTPNFTFDDAWARGIIGSLGLVGREVAIWAEWQNTGEGLFANYAEVDVYHESNLNTPIWVGTLEGVLGADETIRGQFLNSNPNDAFAEHWIPQQAGTYLLKFYADPEHLWAESDEVNNEEQAKAWIFQLPQWDWPLLSV
jgi:hypothetical protein